MLKVNCDGLVLLPARVALHLVATSHENWDKPGITGKVVKLNFIGIFVVFCHYPVYILSTLKVLCYF